MKRTLTYISGVLLLITALCISCQKEQNSLEEKGAPANEVVIRATISDAATKVSFTEEDNKLKTAWETDDSIVGWDAEGNAIELEIASIEDNTAIFKTAEGSAPIPTSGKVYMIYAPGKTKANISNKTLEYDLSNQGSGKLPALMTASGEVSNNVLALNFTNRLAIVAVKNPTFPVTEATTITGLQLSGDNILTTATFSEDGSDGLQMNSSVDGTITRACNFTTAADGTTSETMVYFAVLPNTTEANVTVSTTAPTGYQISFSGKSFTAGQCYMLDQKDINKQTFTVTVADGVTGGTISTSPSGNVAWGETVTVTATPSDGYELTALKYNDGSDHDILSAKSFTMPKANVTVSGTFTPISYTLTGTPSPTEGGSVTFTKGGTTATVAYFGDEITIVSTPNTDYVFSSVSAVNASSNPVTITDGKFTMPASNVTVTTIFAKKSFGITKTDVTVTGGSFTVKKGGAEVTSAQWDDTIKVEVTATPSYYAFDEIKVYKTGDTSVTVPVDADGTFTMPKYDVTIEVTFTPDGSAPPTEMPETIGL